MKSRCLTATIAFVSSITYCLCGIAPAYNFVKIADSAEGDFEFLSSPAINNSGTVVFRAKQNNGPEAIYTSDGGPLQILADTTGPLRTFSAPAISNNGTVAIYASLDSGGTRLFTYGNGEFITIAATSASLQHIQSPSISDDGTVYFSGGPTLPWQAIYSGDGGGLATLYNIHGVFSSLSSPSVNATGTIAFLAGLDAGGAGIFRGNGGVHTKIADGNGPFKTDFGGVVPDVNDSGLVVFFAFLDAGGWGLFRSDGSTTTTIVQGSIDTFRSPNINSLGTVVFELGAGKGIYTGPDSVDDRVIAPGDLLFGSVVNSAYLSSNRQSLNDSGDITFLANLADGRQVIAVAHNTLAQIRGDFNRDGIVDAADYVVWRKTHGDQVEPCGAADANCNGFIDNLDIQTWLTEFGESATLASSLAVPEAEPVILLLVCLTIVSLARLR